MSPLAIFILSFVGFGLILFVIPGVLILRARDQRKRHYRESLSALRQDPTNQQLKTQALVAGRRFYGHVNMMKNAVHYDVEKAIQNDIRSASGEL